MASHVLQFCSLRLTFDLMLLQKHLSCPGSEVSVQLGVPSILRDMGLSAPSFFLVQMPINGILINMSGSPRALPGVATSVLTPVCYVWHSWQNPSGLWHRRRKEQTECLS